MPSLSIPTNPVLTLGVDVSAAQGRVNWTMVGLHGVRFAYVKAAEGNNLSVRDSFHVLNNRAARDAGIYTGAYVVPWPIGWEPTRKPTEQAKRHVDALTEQYDLPLAIDAEWPPPESWGRFDMDGSSSAAWLREYVGEVEILTRKKPVLYTYPYYWAALRGVEWAVNTDLWIANYRDIDKDAPSGLPPILSPWYGWTLWQWSADGGKRIPGVAGDIDRNVFNGDEAALRKWAGLDATPCGV